VTIAIPDLASPDLLADALKTGMHVRHEHLKMRPTLGGEFNAVEEQVHEHRLDPPDRAINIHSARFFAGAVAEAD
jgi:hypothetical protein